MTWQIIVGLLLLLNGFTWIYAFSKGAGPETSHQTVVFVLGVLGLTAFMVVALSAGGFW